jgi:hypothetical protein
MTLGPKSAYPGLSVVQFILKVRLIARCPDRAASRNVRRRSVWLIVGQALAKGLMYLRLAEVRNRGAATRTVRGVRSAATRASLARRAVVLQERGSSRYWNRCTVGGRVSMERPGHLLPSTGEDPGEEGKYASMYSAGSRICSGLAHFGPHDWGDLQLPGQAARRYVGCLQRWKCFRL